VDQSPELEKTAFNVTTIHYDNPVREVNKVDSLPSFRKNMQVYTARNEI